MHYKEIKRNEFLERIITDILKTDMEEGNIGFLELAYDKLGLHDGKRIMQMRKKYNKTSSKIENTVYEDIIGIIVEEICRGGNKELYDDLMTYYKERFPYLKEKLENSEDDAHNWMEIYDASFSQDDSGNATFLKRSFVLLYCITYGQKGAVKTLLDMCKEDGWLDEHYEDGRLLFYDRQKECGNYTDWMCEEKNEWHIPQNNDVYELFRKEQREWMAEDFDIEPEEIEEFVVDNILCSIQELQGTKNKLYNLKYDTIQDSLNDICKKYNITQMEFWDTSKRQDYIEMMKKIYRNWSKREIHNLILDENEDDDEGFFVGYGNLSAIYYGDTERCLSELTTLFWFENYAINLQKLLDKYYENFSFDSHGKDYEDLCKANARLTEELNQYKKKFQQYADAESERKQKENKEAKKAERQYIEKIALLEKKLKEYEKEMARQKEVLSERDTYIGLLETGNDMEGDVKEADVSKLYSHRILFVGGLPEMISRLKSVFSNATFIDNETMPAPQKPDLIVLLTGYMNHALYYKYIGLARDKGIKMTYCNRSNIESITMQVANCL